MCSYGLAVNFQEKAIDAWKGHGPSAHDELKEAERILDELKMKACDEFEEQKMLPLHHGRRRSSRTGLLVDRN